MKQGLEESARKYREAPPEDRATAELMLSSSTLDVSLLETTLVQQKDNLKAIQLLHVMRYTCVIRASSRCVASGLVIACVGLAPCVQYYWGRVVW